MWRFKINEKLVQILLKPKRIKISGGNFNKESTLLTWLRNRGKTLFRLPFLKRLRPLLSRANAVTLPSKLLFVQSNPEPAALKREQKFSVISANLWHDWPRMRRLHERLDAFADLVQKEDADVVLLQEATRKADLDTARSLAERLGMAYVYSRANGEEAIGFEEGLAVLSRFPIRSQNIIQLNQKRDSFIHRIALSASLETPWGNITAVSAHLAVFPKPNRYQFRNLQEEIHKLSAESPVFLGGDFNAHEISKRLSPEDAGLIDTFRDTHCCERGITHILHLPWGWNLAKRRLDYIFMSSGKTSWRTLDVRHYFNKLNPLSDHAFVIASFTPI